MIRLRRILTRTETVERLLVLSTAADGSRNCHVCPPGAGWLTLEGAAEVSGSNISSLLDLAENGELHAIHGPDGVALICAISLSLKILKGDVPNETHIP